MQCEKCDLEHHGEYGSGRFCSAKCARSFSTTEKRQEINQQVSERLKKILDIVGITCKMCPKQFRPSHRREVCCSKDCKEKNRKTAHAARTKKQKELSGAKSSRGKYKRNPQSILDLSSRTVGKIIQRLGIGCSRPECGWNEATCDIHHIRGRSIPNADHHSNLTCLCPNCHRLFHSGKITESDIVSLEKRVGDRWKEYYYG